MRGISRVAENLSASQEGLSSMEQVSKLITKIPQFILLSTAIVSITNYSCIILGKYLCS